MRHGARAVGCCVVYGVLSAAAAGVLRPAVLTAADQWIEVKTGHFTVVSNAGERTTRRLAWQLEQVRSATSTLWAWAKPDLNKPLSIIVLKDEHSLRAFAPQYWETRGSVRPAAVWVTGPDQHYLAIRADVEVEERGTINPYISAYGSYVHLVLAQSFENKLPAWFHHGYTGVLSNLIVQEDKVLVGAPMPWHLELLRVRPLLPLPKLLAVADDSPDITNADRRQLFEAQSWAFVHFLMFADKGKRADSLNAYSKLISRGADPAVAFAETIGPADALEHPFRIYIQQSIFTYHRFDIDVSVEREKFPVRPLPAADASAARALFLAVVNRPGESRAAIAEARKADPNAPGSYLAEALMFDRADQPAEARAAYARAAENGATSAYGYYRLAALAWQAGQSREVLPEVEKLLLKAVSLNPRYAAAYAWLGEIRVVLGNEAGLGFIRRAIAIEPGESRHRVRAAHVSLRQGKHEDARVDADAALRLAKTEDERREAQAVMDLVARSGQPTGKTP
jgi:tetratricopeptide (TPR) repeat protein